MFGNIRGSGPTRSRGIAIRKVGPVAERGRGLLYCSPTVWTDHLTQWRTAAMTGGVPGDIRTGHSPKTIQYWHCATFRIPWHAFFIIFLWFFSHTTFYFSLIPPVPSLPPIVFLYFCSCNFLPLPSCIFYPSSQLRTRIFQNFSFLRWLHATISPKLLQTFSRLLSQQIDFNIFSSNV